MGDFSLLPQIYFCLHFPIWKKKNFSGFNKEEGKFVIWLWKASLCNHPSNPAGRLFLMGRQLLMHELNSVTGMSGEEELLYLEDKKEEGAAFPSLPVSLR